MSLSNTNKVQQENTKNLNREKCFCEQKLFGTNIESKNCKDNEFFKLSTPFIFISYDWLRDLADLGSSKLLKLQLKYLDFLALTLVMYFCFSEFCFSYFLNEVFIILSVGMDFRLILINS